MWATFGQDGVVRALEQSLRDGSLAHAYLVVGPARVGKGTLARDLAQAVNCLNPDSAPCLECAQCARIAAGRHADVVTLAVEEAEGHKELRLDQVREALRMASLLPYEGRWRVFIIDGAEELNDESANALLKSLEEPPPRVLWLLLTGDEDRVHATVRSRCQRIVFRPLSAEQIALCLREHHAAPPEQALLLGRLARGALGWALHALRDVTVLEARTRTLDRLAGMTSATLEERFAYASELAGLIPRERTALRESLDLWACWWRDILLLLTGVPQAVWNQDRLEELRERAPAFRPAEAAVVVQLILQARQHLDMNVNPRLALEHLMLRVPQSTAAAPAAPSR